MDIGKSIIYDWRVEENKPSIMHVSQEVYDFLKKLASRQYDDVKCISRYMGYDIRVNNLLPFTNKKGETIEAICFNKPESTDDLNAELNGLIKMLDERQPH